MFWSVLVALVMVGGGVLVAWAYKSSRRPAPPLDLPAQEDLRILLDACIGLTIAGQDAGETSKRFLAGAAYWRAKRDGMPEDKCLELASEAYDAHLEIKVVNGG